LRKALRNGGRIKIVFAQGFAQPVALVLGTTLTLVATRAEVVTVTATMEDVARLAGVSITTVSHVINRTRTVSDEARRRVKDAITSTGYIHPAMTRGRTVGVAISDISDPFCAQLVGAIESELQPRDFTILLTETHDRADQELRVVRALEQRRVDGLLLTAVHGHTSDTLRYLQDRQLPTVLVDRCASGQFDQAGTENVEAVAKLVDHLADLGHTRIGMVHSLLRVATTEERIKGFHTGLSRRSLPSDTRLVVSGGADVELAERAVAHLFSLADPPTALVIGNGLMGIGALRAIRKLGMTIPRDVAVVTFDDSAWAEHVSSPLTAVAQQVEKIGTEAVRLLFDRFNDPGRAERTIRVDPEFKHRESCGCRLDN
jgi:LacI family transcriptional regulator